MATDQQVTARMVLEAQLELERRGAAAFMQHLEKIEPELANFVLETLSLIYTKLSDLGGPPQKTKRVFRSMQTLLMVSIEALRRGHLELWEKQMGPALEQLDPETGSGSDRQPETSWRSFGDREDQGRANRGVRFVANGSVSYQEGPPITRPFFLAFRRDIPGSHKQVGR